ncbi:MAG: hypothetical protein EPN89_09925 [Methylovulum sp.]|jgi:hypothetical protein|nr:MAG: hypothetical protein EPN89_09925 [Methylovulum sp.]
MKITTIFKSALLITTLVHGSASAYSPEEKDTVCKKPRFTDFTLTTYNAPENIEVAPESEFYFRVSAWADPSTISLTVKNKPLKFTVESNSSFHKVKAKLPAELTGQFARINTGAKALLGCDDQAGWLVKVAKK